MLIHALDEQGAVGIQMDACDVVWRNKAAISFDIRKELSKIMVKTLVIGIEGDQFFPPEIDVIPLSKSIKNSQLFIYQSDLGHLGINEIDKMKDVISKFISTISSE
jgi:homoserine O-acetyltransferase